jgi:hypothetical protein
MATGRRGSVLVLAAIALVAGVEEIVLAGRLLLGFTRGVP